MWPSSDDQDDYDYDYFGDWYGESIDDDDDI